MSFQIFFFTAYDLHRAAIAVWVVGRLATLFSKAKRAYIGFVWVYKIDSLHSKKAGEEKGEPSVQFRDQRGAVLKIENQENVVICNKKI